MNLGDYEFEWPTDTSGNALVQEPGTILTTGQPSTTTWNWSSFWNAAFPFASTVYTQQQITQRQQNQLTATPPAPLVGGIPLTYILLGAGLFLLVKK